MISHQCRPAATALSAVALPPRSLIDQMVDKILEMGMNGIAVTADSLFEHSGFTSVEIEKHGRAACDIARTRATRQVA